MKFWGFLDFHKTPPNFNFFGSSVTINEPHRDFLPIYFLYQLGKGLYFCTNYKINLVHKKLNDIERDIDR